ncbi:phosphatase PAP2 family protein [Salipaludibacillus aurantiacus]|uniref:Undecaprenyl-diphosphatase n=1 Tax=Salipaludibacillus aurantiacus TaxID=1601833 RepID=A0A1H9S7S6_9BACI|nr:phosphatase PAP2 family protein [Salipaludibacillus aurantiacus]SER80968.1 undecaprenyl-diphosphatase [Salipaludibacillus aurantiacus]
MAHRLTERITEYDINIFQYVNGQLRCKVLDLTLPKLTHLGGASFTLSILALLLFISNFSNSHAALTALASLTVSHVIAHFLKKKYCRERPYNSVAGCNLVSAPLKDYSFPSGHSTAAFSLAVTFSLHAPMLSLILLPLAGCIAMSRMYLGLHYPSDCIIGALLGSISALLMVTLFNLM